MCILSNNMDILCGRPFGVYAILWQRDVLAKEYTVATGSSRICVLHVCFHNFKLLLINN